VDGASDRRVPPVARWLLVALVSGSIFVASVVPPPGEGLQLLGPLGLVGLDAWFHALAYAGLAGSLLYAMAATDRPLPVSVALALGVAVAFGFGVELVQAFLPIRRFEWLDVVANGFGASLAAATWIAVRRLLRIT